jgi:ABC-type nitrate/sulfonate/bicarbonate transport system substrate-binding protein
MKRSTLWFTRCPVPSPQTVAINLGWLSDEFASDGIEVRSLASSLDPRVHASHYSHSQSDSFRFGGIYPPLIARSRGADLRIIGLGWVDRKAGIYRLQDRTRELKGARLSVPRRLNDDIDWWRAAVLDGYRHTLSAAGLTFDDVQLVEVDIERRYADDAVAAQGSHRSLWGARSQFAVQREEVLALARGTVDAIYTDGAMGALLKAFLGLEPLVEVTSSVEAPLPSFGAPVVLTVSGQLLDERPDLVDRWVGRLLDAQRWVTGHADAFRSFAARDSGVPDELFEDSYTSAVSRQIDVSLTPARVDRLRAQYEHLLAHGFVQPFDLDATIDHGPLERAWSNRTRAA